MNQIQPMQPQQSEMAAPVNSPLGNVANTPFGSATPSLDLPASLQGLLGPSSPQVGVNPGAITPLSGAPVAPNPNAPLFDINAQPAFAQGGMVDPSQPMMGGGMPPQGGMPMGVGVNPQQGEQVTEQDIQMFMQQQPQAVQQIASQLQQLVQTGEVSMQQLNMAEQLAMVALQNPQMYPQMRQFAIRQGLIEEQDISPQYDQGLLFTIILGARAVKGMGGGAGMQPTQPMEEPMNFADGGYVTPGSNAKNGGKVVGPGTGTSDSIPIRVSAGEYVIPAHIVQEKGKEFFDGMLAKYKK
jgi:uncharacterized protein YlaN (UPF0358 family)